MELYLTSKQALAHAHAQYHSWFRSFLYAREYYDIFLFDLNGNLVYSVFKERDYAPSANIPTSFISTPIVNHEGRMKGVLVFQMPIGRINKIMQNTDGMGESSESYIIGAMEIISRGDTSIEVPESKRKDEIGDIAQALEVFKQNRIDADRLSEEQKTVQNVQLKRAEKLESLTNGFEETISDLINGLAAASTELGVQTDTLKQKVAELLEQVKSV